MRVFMHIQFFFFFLVNDKFVEKETVRPTDECETYQIIDIKIMHFFWDVRI